MPALYDCVYERCIRGYPVVDFVQPKGIEWTLIDPKTGLLALSKTPKAYLEASLKGQCLQCTGNQSLSRNLYLKTNTRKKKTAINLPILKIIKHFFKIQFCNFRICNFHINFSFDFEYFGMNSVTQAKEALYRPTVCRILL
jgi:hypothetical protein